MSDRGRCLIDGRGVDRVCRHLRAEAFRVDPATTDDARRLWEWSNDPDVRAGSFSTEPIPWETHVTWLKKRLCDPTCRIYIVCDCSGQGLGQVRFEINGRTATISIGLALAARGRGYGSQLVWMACARLFDNTDVDRVEALIRLDNAGSIRVFEKAEFVSVGETEVKQQPARRFTLERGQLA